MSLLGVPEHYYEQHNVDIKSSINYDDLKVCEVAADMLINKAVENKIERLGLMDTQKAEAALKNMERKKFRSG